MGHPRDTNGVQSAADQSANSVIGSGTTKREAKKKPVTMMGVGVKESVEEAVHSFPTRRSSDDRKSVV